MINVQLTGKIIRIKINNLPDSKYAIVWLECYDQFSQDRKVVYYYDTTNVDYYVNTVVGDSVEVVASLGTFYDCQIISAQTVVKTITNQLVDPDAEFAKAIRNQVERYKIIVDYSSLLAEAQSSKCKTKEVEKVITDVLTEVAKINIKSDRIMQEKIAGFIDKAYFRTFLFSHVFFKGVNTKHNAVSYARTCLCNIPTAAVRAAVQAQYAAQSMSASARFNENDRPIEEQEFNLYSLEDLDRMEV